MFELSLALHLSLVLQSAHPELLALLVQHFLQFVNHALEAAHLVLFSLYFALGLVDQSATLLLLLLMHHVCVKSTSISASGVQLASLLLSSALLPPAANLALEPLVLVDAVDVQLFAGVFLPVFDDALVEVDLLANLGVFLLLHDQLLDQQLPVVLLRLVLALQLLVFLHQRPVFIINPLGNVSDELQVVVQLVLPVLQVGGLVTFLGLALLDLLLHLGELGVELADDVLLLLFLQLLGLRLDAVDVVVQLPLQSGNDLLVFLVGVRLVAVAHTQLSLQVFYVLPVLKLAFHVTILSAGEIFLDFAVFLRLGF